MPSSDEHGDFRSGLLVRSEGLPVRLFSYALFSGLLTEAIVKGAAQGYFAAVGAEGGPIEHAQYALCGSAAVLFARAGARSAFRDVFSLASFGAMLGVIREADAFFDTLLFHGAFKLPAAVVGVIALRRAYRARATLLGQVLRWTETPSFAVTACGVFVVLIYAQLVGQKEFWQSLMGASYIRPVKDVAEEIQELLGYFFIFFGAFESYLLARASESMETMDANPGLE